MCSSLSEVCHASGTEWHHMDFFMLITSIISSRAQALLPENDKRKETYKKLSSLLVILILSNSIFHFINHGVPLKQISEKKHVTLMMKGIWLNRFLNIPLNLKSFIIFLKLGRNSWHFWYIHSLGIGQML